MPTETLEATQNGTSNLKDVGTITWSEAIDTYNVPTLHRYKLSPGMLTGTETTDFENGNLKIKGTIEFNRNFAIAKIALHLKDLDMYDSDQIEELLGEVADYRQKQIEEDKQRVTNELLATLQRLNPKAAAAARKELEK